MEIGNMIFGNSRGAHPIDRAKWQQVFYDRPGVSKLSGDDVPPDGNWRIVHLGGHHYWTNDRWIFMPYYWGEDAMVQRLPNFVDLVTGIEIQWYKYPMRDAYSNVPIPDEWWSTIDLTARLREEDL